jgi:hypothetical protein
MEQRFSNVWRTPKGAQNTREGLDTSSRQANLTLALLSGAVEYGRPLPAHFEAPLPFAFGPVWARFHGDVRGGRSDESVDSAFAVILVMSELICKELGFLVLDVRELVGEVNFEVGRNKGLHVGDEKLD